MTGIEFAGLLCQSGLPAALAVCFQTFGSVATVSADHELDRDSTSPNARVNRHHPGLSSRAVEVTCCHFFGIQTCGFPIGPAIGNAMWYEANSPYLVHHVITGFLISRVAVRVAPPGLTSGSPVFSCDAPEENQPVKRRNEPSIGFLARLTR